MGSERRIPDLVEKEPAPGLLRGRLSMPMERLPIVKDDSILAMLERNREDPWPVQNGFTRELDQSIQVDLSLDRVASDEPLATGQIVRVDDDSIRFAGVVRVDDSYAFRIRLDNVRLPEGSKIWLYSPSEPGLELGPFGLDLLHEGGIWLPALDGPEIAIEVAVPRSGEPTDEGIGFEIGRIVEVFDLEALRESERFGGNTTWTACALDALCLSTDVTVDAREATARLTYVENGSSWLCTGSIINDTVGGSTIPYLLTANHCFDTQASATSLTAFFDYYRAGCVVGPIPSLGSVPQVSGSQLLTTAVNGDVTLVRLNAEPPTAYRLLGWTTADPANGDSLFRTSHPAGSHMRVAAYLLDRPPAYQCSGNYDSAYAHYSTNNLGSTAGGSSGSAVLNENGQIVGQLQGSCGNVDDRCDFESFYTVDGKFSVNYPRLVQWINPSSYFSDFVIDSVNLSTTSIPWGGTLTASTILRNQGYEPSGFTVRFLRSTNSIISQADSTLGGNVISSPLGWQDTFQYSGGPFTFTESGTFWIGACVDPGASEGPTDNNCSSGIQITVAERSPLIFDDRFEP